MPNPRQLGDLSHLNHSCIELSALIGKVQSCLVERYSGVCRCPDWSVTWNRYSRSRPYICENVTLTCAGVLHNRSGWNITLSWAAGHSRSGYTSRVGLFYQPGPDRYFRDELGITMTLTETLHPHFNKHYHRDRPANVN